MVNCAGGNVPGATIPDDKSVFDMKIEDFEKVTGINMNGTVHPSLVFGESMAKKVAQHNHRILNGCSDCSDTCHGLYGSQMLALTVLPVGWLRRWP